jgi:hypothetical protein
MLSFGDLTRSVHAVRPQIASAPLQSSCPVSGKMRPTLTNARRASATAAVSCGSEEAGTGTGAEAGDGTGADVSIGGVRAGTGAAGATPAVSLHSEEADTGAGGLRLRPLVPRGDHGTIRPAARLGSGACTGFLGAEGDGRGRVPCARAGCAFARSCPAGARGSAARFGSSAGTVPGAEGDSHGHGCPRWAGGERIRLRSLHTARHAPQ